MSLKNSLSFEKIKEHGLNVISLLLLIVIIVLAFIYSIQSHENAITDSVAINFILGFIVAISLFIIVNSIRNDKNLGTLSNDIKAIKRVIDTESSIPDSTFRDIVELFFAINSKFSPYKNKCITNIFEEFQSMLQNKCTLEIPYSDGFLISIPALEKLGPGDRVYAVTFGLREKGSKYDTIPWHNYLDANITAAKKGASVERVFITDESKLKTLLETDWVQKHTDDPKNPENQTKLVGYHINKQVFDHQNTEFKKRINYGFLLINSEILIIDKFYDNDNKDYWIGDKEDPFKYTVIVSIDEDLIKQLILDFNNLIKLDGPCKGRRLSNSLIADKR